MTDAFNKNFTERMVATFACSYLVFSYLSSGERFSYCILVMYSWFFKIILRVMNFQLFFSFSLRRCSMHDFVLLYNNVGFIIIFRELFYIVSYFFQLNFAIIIWQVFGFQCGDIPPSRRRLCVSLSLCY